jgi:DNA-binding transcriptional LysR family regulator
MGLESLFLDTKLLRTFAAVARSGSMTRAAIELGVSQPAVSVQILKLEEQVGFELFIRADGRLRPTPAGTVFYSEVNKALGGIERLSQSALEIRTGHFGTVTVAAHPSASISLLPEVLARFGRDRPGVFVRMLTRHSHAISQMVPAQSFDVGVAECPLDEKDVVVRRFRLKCVAIVPSGHPLANHAELTPSLMAGQPFIGASSSHLVDMRVRSAFEEAGADLNVVASTEMYASTCALVAGGLGCSIIDSLSARTFASSGLETRPFSPDVHYDIGVFHAQSREPSMLASAFLETLYEALAPYSLS